MEKKLYQILSGLKKESEQTRPELKKVYQTTISTLSKTHSLTIEMNSLNELLLNSINLIKKLNRISVNIEADIQNKIIDETKNNLFMASNSTINLILKGTETNIDILKDIFKIREPLKEILELIINKGDNRKMQKAIESFISLSKTGLGLIPMVGAAFAIIFEIGNQYTIYNNKEMKKASSRLDEVEQLSVLLINWNLITNDFVNEVKRIFNELLNTINHINDRQNDIKQSLSDYLEKGEFSLIVRELP
jgi:hypothetical protein